LLPGEFSTLTLGLIKTGLLEKLNSSAHAGGTLFAPPNGAFKKLGPRINAFLFSKYGEKYLKALLEYHVVANQTLYSTAFVNKTTALDLGFAGVFGSPAVAQIEGTFNSYPDTLILDKDADSDVWMYHPPGKRPHHPPGKPPHHPPPEHGDGPHPHFHFDLPTLLGRDLPVDIARYGPFVIFKVNGFVRVVVQDGIAKDGVIQVVNNILIPPRKLPGAPGVEEEYEFWDGKEMELDDFKERFAPIVQDDGYEEVEAPESKWDF
jgi:uncharacterized surface protein with fasciclin (FAS1) repeats